MNGTSSLLPLPSDFQLITFGVIEMAIGSGVRQLTKFARQMFTPKLPPWDVMRKYENGMFSGARVCCTNGDQEPSASARLSNWSSHFAFVARSSFQIETTLFTFSPPGAS